MDQLTKYDCITEMAATVSPGPERGANMGIEADLTTVLRSVVAQGDGGQLLIEDAANSLGLSVRTLQRRLAKVGLSYSTLRDQVRLEEACRMIRRPHIRLIDVAYHLGFSDPGHFTRAFQNWTGMAPRQFRRHMRHGKANRGQTTVEFKLSRGLSPIDLR